jgi:hypothetical protein
MMMFAKRCEKAGETVEYHPCKIITVQNLPSKKPEKKNPDP